MTHDWNKVLRYSKHLGIIPSDLPLEKLYTNNFVPESPSSDIEPLGGCLSA